MWLCVCACLAHCGLCVCDQTARAIAPVHLSISEAAWSRMYVCVCPVCLKSLHAPNIFGKHSNFECTYEYRIMCTSEMSEYILLTHTIMLCCTCARISIWHSMICIFCVCVCMLVNKSVRWAFPGRRARTYIERSWWEMRLRKVHGSCAPSRCHSTHFF